jgi:KipI family sensor histidine kinase inhibitor
MQKATITARISIASRGPSVTVDYTLETLAEDALLLRFGNGIDATVNARVHAAARALREAALPGVADIAPAYASLLLRFDPFARVDTEPGKSPHAHMAGIVRAVLLDASAKTLGPGSRRDDEQKPDASGSSPRTIEIPVCYGREYGPDLVEVAAHAEITPGDVIEKHASVEYAVAMLGFAPGFPYLLGLDPALEVPRRANPRTRVPAGSVAIGGAQTGIYPRELPGGWQLIGRTPLALFDPRREPPCLLAPGDKVRFCAIDNDEFETLSRTAT